MLVKVGLRKHIMSIFSLNVTCLLTTATAISQCDCEFNAPVKQSHANDVYIINCQHAKSLAHTYKIVVIDKYILAF